MSKRSIMLGALALLLWLPAVAKAEQTLLLDFYADWCGPCRTMMPIVEQLENKGYPVKRIDVDRQPELAQRFHVQSLPTFIMLVDGREADRVVGSTSLEKLESLCRLAPKQPDASAPRVPLAPTRRGDTGGGSPQRETATAADDSASNPASIGRKADGKDIPSMPSGVRFASGTEEDLLAATVRIHVRDSNGVSRGSGTIIDARSGEALIVTCGHLFRDWDEQGKITVDLFAPEAASDVPATLVRYSYDQSHDTALISMRTELPLVVARVAPPGYPIQVNDPTFNVGCSDGAPPTVRHGQVTAIDKYLGFGNIETSGAPVQGRSGGGLFSADGYLIGVCNAADPRIDEGLYASLVEIHRELDQAKLSFVYEPADSTPAQLASHTRPGSPSRAGASAGSAPPASVEPDVVPMQNAPSASALADNASAVPDFPRRMPRGSAESENLEDRTLASGLPLPVPAGTSQEPDNQRAPDASAMPSTPSLARNGSGNRITPVVAQGQAGGLRSGTAGRAPENLSLREQAAWEEIQRRRSEGYEVICIVRPAGQPQASSEVIVLRDMSPEFVGHLAGRSDSPSDGGAAPPSATVAGDRQMTEITQPATEGTQPTGAAGSPPLPAAILPIPAVQ